ncbi:MAG: type II secretion system protein [Bacteroidota bacterium]
MKYRGFTLIEMSLALALMGILMLVGTEVWSIMGKIHALYSEQQSKGYESLILRQTLARDLYTYPNWQLSRQEVYHIVAENDTLIKYSFRPTQVLRRYGHFTDTFRFSLYVQPFGQDAVLTLVDSNAAVWFRREMWSLAHAIPN